MNAAAIKAQLARIASEDVLANEGDALIGGWISAGAGSDAIEPILRFMETHPGWSFGMPGPLVHFVERFYRHGYEEELKKSVQRKPTPHTVWMLNRVINGEKSPERRAALLAVLKGVTLNRAADRLTSERAHHFLSLHD